MATWLGSPRSTESPMDFEYTSRPTSNVKPAWASDAHDPSTPRKRALGDMNPPLSPFPGPSSHTPTFGRIQNVPFMLNIPPPQTPERPAWVPPAEAHVELELRDVDMAEASPPHVTMKDLDEYGGAEASSSRLIATGGMKRVFRSRQKMKERKSRLALSLIHARAEREDGEAASESDEGDDDDDRTGSSAATPITQNMSNHYTLNIPGHAPPRSETPYILLGYLQVFFNLSLILLFLYLLVLFILTVQRDVEHRVSEYSMDIVQEIAQCAAQFKSNLCAMTPIPAMLHQCGIWETCMNRDPTKVGRAKVGAELIAEVVNGFVEPISWKTLAFTLTSLSFLTVFVNSLLSLYRSKHTPPPAVTHTHPPIPTYPIATPSPYPAHMLSSTPAWAKTWPGAPDVQETPARRRKLESGAAREIK